MWPRPQTYDPAHTVFNATTTFTTTNYSNATTIALRTYINVGTPGLQAINIAAATSTCPNLIGVNAPTTFVYAVLLSSVAAGTTCTMTAQITLGNAGTYSFAPDLTNGGQTTVLASGTPVDFVITPAATSTTLTSSVNPTTFGQSTTFTATVKDTSNGNVALPDGDTVTFLNGATVLGTGTTSGGTGTATFATNTLGGGAHTITARHEASNNYAASTSPAFTQNVNRAATFAKVTLSVNPTIVGQDATFTATLTDNSNGGIALPDNETVTFLDGIAALGTGTTGGGNGQTTLTTNLLTAGTHSITASYAGNTNHAASVSSTSSFSDQMVFNAQGQTATVTFAPVSPITAGTSDVLTVTITAGSTDLYFDTVSASIAPVGFTLPPDFAGTSCSEPGIFTASRRTAITASIPGHLTKGSSCSFFAPAATPDPGTYTASVVISQNGGTVATGSGMLIVGLATPTLNYVIPGDAQVTVNWNAVTGATAYTVQRSTDGGTSFPTSFPGITATNYIDTTAANGTAYTYRVVATAGAGSITSPPSNTLTATPLAYHANDDAYTTMTGTTLTVSAPGVLGNDTSPFGSLSVDTVTPAAHGNASVSGDGSFIYTPAPGFVGTDTFTYQAMNNLASPGPASAPKPRVIGDTNAATVTITVTKAPVDLVATLTATAPSVVAGTNTTLTAVFTSTGANPTSATTATLTLSANAQYTPGAPVTSGTAPTSITASGGVLTLIFAPGAISNASISVPIHAVSPATAPTITVNAATVQSLVATGSGPTGAGSGVVLSPGAATMRAGTNFTLATVATYTDGTHSNATGLTYSGYNANVISVSTSGVVTALGAGTTTVTITAPNGVTTTFTITVTDGSGGGLMAPAPQPGAKPAGVTAIPGGTVAPQPTRKADAAPASGVQPAVTAPTATPNAQPARR